MPGNLAPSSSFLRGALESARAGFAYGLDDNNNGASTRVVMGLYAGPAVINPSSSQVLNLATDDAFIAFLTNFTPLGESSPYAFTEERNNLLFQNLPYIRENLLGVAGPVGVNGRDTQEFLNAGVIWFYWIWNGTTLDTIASERPPYAVDFNFGVPIGGLLGPILPATYTHWGVICCVPNVIRYVDDVTAPLIVDSAVVPFRSAGPEIRFITPARNDADDGNDPDGFYGDRIVPHIFRQTVLTENSQGGSGANGYVFSLPRNGLVGSQGVRLPPGFFAGLCFSELRAVWRVEMFNGDNIAQFSFIPAPMADDLGFEFDEGGYANVFLSDAASGAPVFVPMTFTTPSSNIDVKLRGVFPSTYEIRFDMYITGYRMIF